MKKISIFIIALAVMMPPTPVGATGIPVVDVAHIAETILGVGQETITAAEQTISTLQDAKAILDRYALGGFKQALMTSLQDKIIGYAQGGKGGAKFVENWETYFKSARLTGAQDFANSLKGAKLCDTFKNQVLKEVGSSGGSGGSKSDDGTERFNCDFKDGELKKFNQDFKQGGWDAYRKMLKPNNNYLGTITMAKEAQQAAITEAEKAAEAEAISGAGFLSAKKGGSITTPGSLIKDLTAGASKADFDLITNADEVTDLIALAGSMVDKLTEGNDNGLAGISLRQRRKNRNKTRDASGNRITYTRDEAIEKCNEEFPESDDPEEDESALRAACIENAAAENGGQAGGTLRKAQLMKNIENMIKMREAAKKAFKETLAKINKNLNVFDKNNDDKVDASLLCTASLPGRNKKKNANERWPDGDGVDETKEVPSSLTTGKIYSATSKKSRRCAIQDFKSLTTVQNPDPTYYPDLDPADYPNLIAFDSLLPSRNELLALRSQNETALSLLINFRRRARTVSPTNEEALDELADELLTGAQAAGLGDTGALTEETVYVCDDGFIYGSDQAGLTCSSYTNETYLFTPSIAGEPTYYICGADILAHPEFNQECTDYTVTRAKDEADVERPEIPDGEFADECNPDQTDATKSDYCEE